MRGKYLFSESNRCLYVQVFSGTLPTVLKWAFLCAGAASLFVSFSLVVRAASSWAQCGADSYVECSGGVKCTAIDQVGCSCYDVNNRLVLRRSCRGAATEEEEFMLMENDY